MAPCPISYEEFFVLPSLKPTTSKECKAKCKLCNCQEYKYTLTSKGNLLKHLQNMHEAEHQELSQRKRKEQEDRQTTLTQSSCSITTSREFRSQDRILTSLVRNVIGSGGLPIQIAEQVWFRKFLYDIEPRFKPVSRVAIKRKLDCLYDEDRQQLAMEVSEINHRPSVTVDFWSGRDNRSFMGCTIHYVYGQEIKRNMLFFREVPPPHTSENIRNRFEDELDRCKVKCFQVVTDNAANMKCAFISTSCIALNEVGSEDQANEDEDDYDEHDDPVSLWTPQPIFFEGWIGCACHQLQLVVHDGYKELMNYRRVQSALF